MATAAQIAANRTNAQASTGARTEEAKPSSAPARRRAQAGHPSGARQAAQILHAMWRRRRCAQAEESLAARTGDLDG
ncbi:MAG: hypothetical protein ABSB15_16125 [Bryobacteraceae bacterium]